MELLNSEVPSGLSLDRLCTGALGELEKLGYSRRTLRRYRLVWQHLSAYSRQLNLGDEYSRDLAMRFEDAHGLRDGQCVKQTDAWRRHLVFSVKVLDDYARTGSIVRFIVETKGLRVPQAMHKPLRDFELHARDRRHLRASSLREQMREIAVFLDFLGSRSVIALDQLGPDDISSFITSRRSLRPKTLSRIVSDLRLFLQFLFLRDMVPRDLRSALPTIRVTRNATVPSVWDPELVVKLLEVVDRSSPKGRRDYAILMLASRLGMRSGDIRMLTLDDINWAAATIEITQSKTGAPLCLPLSEEVGAALIDYLKAGRPSTNHRELFLSLKPPFEPFSERNHLYQIVTHWRELAGIQFRTKQRQGLHSLRHTLATRLLCEETPFHVISAVLGHASASSTLIYAKADVEALRGAALNTEGVHHAQ